MSPRKSSTSSGRPSSPPRPRYLGVEVAGDQPLPPRLLEAILLTRLGPTSVPGRVRLIRAEGDRALVEVPHRAVPLARAAWTSSWVTDRGTALEARTHRTFGTLVKGKEWLRGRRAGHEARRGRGV